MRFARQYSKFDNIIIGRFTLILKWIILNVQIFMICVCKTGVESPQYNIYYNIILQLFINLNIFHFRILTSCNEINFNDINILN